MTEKLKHTPGPWEVNDAHDLTIYGGNSTHVATGVWLKSLPETVANAHLIAAAPELLEACEEFVRKCDCGMARSKKSYAQMKAAIAKAKGETL